MKRIIPMLFLTANLILYSQNHLESFKNLAVDEINNGFFYSPGNITYGFSPLIDSSRSIPTLTSWWDYWTNGQNQRMVVVLGDTVIAVISYSDSSNAQVSSGRKVLYNYSVNGGVTWLPSAIQWTSQGNAYPDLWPVFIGGLRTVAVSGREFPAPSKGHAGSDIVLGAGTVTTTILPDAGSDYFTCLISGNQLAGCYQVGDSLFFRKFNYATNTYSSRITVAAPPSEIDANGRKAIAASTDGQRIFVMWWVSTSGTEKLSGKLSTDGGNTFGSATTIMQNGYTIGSDVMFPWFGMDVVFKPNSTNYGAAFCTQPVNNSYREIKILYWSPTINSGNPVKVADWANTPHLSDTMWAYNGSQNVQVGMLLISHPTLAYSTDGSRLYCVFTCAQKDSIYYPGANASYLFNDLVSSYSDNDGLTWSTPVSITSTTAEDEIYPVLSKYGNTPGNFGLLYMKSGFPGCGSFNQTTTPVSRNYTIYTRIDPVTGNQLPIGINTISNEVPGSFSLEQNYPNPFNPATKIRFSLSEKSSVSLKVYNLLGEVVSVLIDNKTVKAGIHEATFSGQNIASGVYFYTLTAGNYNATKKMILVK